MALVYRHSTGAGLMACSDSVFSGLSNLGLFGSLSGKDNSSSLFGTSDGAPTETVLKPRSFCPRIRKFKTSAVIFQLPLLRFWKILRYIDFVKKPRTGLNHVFFIAPVTGDTLKKVTD